MKHLTQRLQEARAKITPAAPVEDEEWSCPFGVDTCEEDARCRECSEEMVAEMQADWIREEGW